MKNRSFVYGGLLLVALSGCLSSQEPFKPTAADNPWEDNYAKVAAMKEWRQWGTYNVHDPSCRKLGDYYYMYSTDAIYHDGRHDADEQDVPTGYIQVRRSRNLVDWEFVGWAFPQIPQEAVEWVHSHTGGVGASNIWAPYIIPYGDRYRLYYCVSAFGRKVSYLGLAEADSPEGPWTQKGCVVKTDESTLMNAIDPSVIVEPESGKWWMHYGSFFGGLYCVELNPQTGLPMTDGDRGHLTARRARYWKDNLEAPEIIYHPQLKKYYLFNSYDPLMTTYNVRVGRADSPEGPFYDFFGKELKDTTNNFPILTAPYRFAGHEGWAGTGHCSVFTSEDGSFFMAHQGRLSPRNEMMDLHLRQLFFTEDGWPVVSPERYACSQPRTFTASDLVGEWEIVRIREPLYERRLEAGQILWGEGSLKEEEWNVSESFSLDKEGRLADGKGTWSLAEEKQLLTLNLDGETVKDLILFAGHDWENRTETVLFTGLDGNGRSVWGKRVK